MGKKIYIHELPCYKVAAEEMIQKEKISPERCFDLSQLPGKELQKEVEAFILERGGRLALASILRELPSFNLICKFISEKEKHLKSFREKSCETLVRRLKAWILENGYSLSYERYRKQYAKSTRQDVGAVVYLRKLYSFLEPEDERSEYEKDIWVLENLGIPLRENPIKKIKKLNFSSIPQHLIREEIKAAIHMEIKHVAIGTVLAELSAVKRFTKYLLDREKTIKSCEDIDRNVIEKYLTYLNTEAAGKKSYRTELIHLKTILGIVGKIKENRRLEQLFVSTDIPGEVQALYKTYSDDVIKKFNACIVKMDEQIARALIIHQMLGTRISDTLTLTVDCLYMKKQRHMVKINSVKGHDYEKAIDEEVAALIQKAIDYTQEQYGDTKYIFVSDTDIESPYQYSMIQSRIMGMIREQDLRDDDGKLLGFDTHVFRHTYGRKLTEMHLDDYTISKLLGHSNISSVKYYRKLSNGALAEETKEMRQTMDQILMDLIKEWDDE